MNKAQARRMRFNRNTTNEVIRGKYFWKERWYSICSTHGNHDKDCPRCQTGHWINVWKNAIGGKIYDWFPGFWRWWVNNI